MTYSSKDFHNYIPYKKGDNIRVANELLASISGTDSVVCTSDIKLSSVLHIPDFLINLLSVNAITKDLNCKGVFYPDYCFFQDLQTGRRIGSGRVHDGLYLMDGDRNSTQAFVGEFKDVNQEIIQWHRRLGHPSFFALEKLYPSLFSKTRFDSLFCDACEYAKHTRNSYHLSSNKSTIPFTTIHSDV